jgi:hypothetical protein
VRVKIYQTVTLPVVLYVCGTWSLRLNGGHMFRVFQNTMLKRMFGTKRKEVVGGWRRLHNEELHS